MLPFNKIYAKQSGAWPTGQKPVLGGRPGPECLIPKFPKPNALPQILDSLKPRDVRSTPLSCTPIEQIRPTFGMFHKEPTFTQYDSNSLMGDPWSRFNKPPVGNFKPGAPIMNYLVPPKQ